MTTNNTTDANLGQAINNNSIEANLGQAINSTNILSVGAFLLRFIAVFATIMNMCVLSLLVRLKRNFRNYSYWFQIVVLSSADLLNGLFTFTLTFFDLEFFRTSAIACGILLWAYACSQINTLLGICCICVNRFRGILMIDKLQEPSFGYQQEISILVAALISIAYSLLPYLIFPLNRSPKPLCVTATLFGSNVKTYKLTLAFGLIIPLAIINVLYSVCLVELRRINAKVKPSGEHERSRNITRVPVTQVSQAGASGERDTSLDMKANTPDFHENKLIDSDRKIKDGSKMTVLEVIPQSTDQCSTSGTDTTGKATEKEKSTTIGVRARTKEAHSRAVKLLGIILIFSNITVIMPASLLIRDTVAPGTQSTGMASIGMLMLPLNSLIDAFIYGFYSVEIRTYIRSNVDFMCRLFRPQMDATR